MSQALTVPPASESDLAASASSGRLAPLGLLTVGLVAAVSIGLMAWSHGNWNALEAENQALQRQMGRLEAKGLAAGLVPTDAATPLRTQLSHAQAVQRQRRLDQLIMGLVGLSAAGVAGLWARSHRRRGRALGALREREAELAAFAGTLPDLAFLLDSECRYLAVYGEQSSLLGRPPEQLIGQPMSAFFPADSVSVFAGVVRRALETRQTQTLSYPVRVMGAQRHFDSRCAPVEGSDRVIWTIWDVTARRRAEQRLVHMTRLYDFLSHVNQAIAWSESEDQLLQNACQTAIRHGQFKMAWISMLDATGQHLKCHAHAGDALAQHIDLLSFERQAAQDSSSPLAQALNDGTSFHCGDLSPLMPQGPAWAQAALDAGLGACAVLPLKHQQALVGFLFLLDRQLNPQDRDEKALLDDVAHDLSFAISNLHKDKQREHAEERIRLHAAALESSRDGMLVLNRQREIVSINRAFTEITGYLEDDVMARSADFLFPDNAHDAIAEMTESLRRQGSWEGEAWCQRQSGELFSTKMSISAVNNTKGLPSHFVAVFTDNTQIKQSEARLARLAHYDPLTELPNRSMIHQRLEHAINLARRHQTLVGVVFIDLDNFKTVNDSLGHAAGDTLLQLVAQRLRQRMRQEDTLGRLGGDEFILVLEHLRHPQQAAHVAQAVIESLSDPFHLGEGQDVYVRASIGISMFPNDSEETGELVRNADAAMYQAKRLGRNTFKFYTESLTSQASNRLQLETRLRRAVEHREFTLHYQPMVRMSDRRVISVEALVRLRVPDTTDACLPSIGPDEFIPVMEDTGMIMALGEWVMNEACRQGRAWLDAGLDFGRLAVNVSASEIRRGGVLDRVSRVLRQTGFPASRLELEITESGLMEHGESAEQFLKQLYELGISLSIDDFGTGYSSLAYLKRFPVHQLKIDRGFVQDLPGNENDAQLVSTMISLAHNLKMRVVAEGVEMPDQEAFLHARGCDIAQGYLFSRPVPAAQIEKLLPRLEARPNEVASL
ncbi:MAG: EAL domain-containing protein [Rubrivivax sp.]|nr:MAG: EAL domain-containing protein [Rubrivivax sp.]